MEAGGGYADLLGDALEVAVYRVAGEVAAQGVGEHQAHGVIPCAAGLQLVFLLAELHPSQHIKHGLGWGEDAGLVVLQGGEFVRPSTAVDALLAQLLAHGDGSLLEVHAIPGQADDLPLAQAGEDVHEQQVLVGGAFDGLQEGLHLIALDGADLLVLHAGQLAGVAGVEADVLQLHSLVEGFVHHAVEVAHRLGGQAAADAIVIQLLDHGRGEGGELHSPQGGDDVLPDLIIVLGSGGGLHAAQVFLVPGFHPGAEGDLRWIGVGSLVDLVGDGAELACHIGLGFAVDGFLYLLARAGIAPQGVAGFPGAILALADRAGAVGVTGAGHKIKLLSSFCYDAMRHEHCSWRSFHKSESYHVS